MRIRPANPVEDPVSAKPPPPLRNRRAAVRLHDPATLRLPCDNFDEDPRRWFHSDLATGAGVPLPVTEGNEVTYLIDGTAYFAKLVEAIRSIRDPANDFIYIIGWIVFLDMPLLVDPTDPQANTFGAGKAPPTAVPWAPPVRSAPRMWAPTLRDLLTDAGQRGVEVRALIFKNPPFASQVEETVRDIRKMPNAWAIEDNRLLFAGAHHQKVIIVRAGGELIGFCGGIDLNPDRLFLQARPNRPTMNESIDIGDPYHDVQCRIRGPGAGYLLQTFVERWKDHQRVFADAELGTIPDLRSVDIQPPLSTMPDPLPLGSDPFETRQFVQIGRTYGDPSHYPPKFDFGYWHFEYDKPLPRKPKLRDDDDDEEDTQPRTVRIQSTYDFAPHGEQSIKQILLRAISQAQRFIYVEDQYLMDVEVARALAAVLPRLSHITILIPSDEDLETSYRLKQYRWRGTDNPELAERGNRILTNHAPWLRRRFFETLLPPGCDPRLKDRVRVFCLSPPGAPHTYVHSKMWIVDDEFALIGSANCCQRSLTHDAELCAAMVDQPLRPSCGFHMPHRLRIALWAEHLDMDTLDGHGELVDGVASAVHWLRRAETPGSRIARYRPADWELTATDAFFFEALHKLMETFKEATHLPIWNPSLNHVANLLTVAIVFDPYGGCPEHAIASDGSRVKPVTWQAIDIKR